MIQSSGKKPLFIFFLKQRQLKKNNAKAKEEQIEREREGEL